MIKKRVQIITGIYVMLFLFFAVSCTTTATKETEYTPSGEISYQNEKIDNELHYELRRIFADKRIEGIGIFENENESLARSSAINLAINDLASKIQTTTKSNSTIYNRNEVREVIETKVNAIVKGYKIEYEGYEPGTKKYRVKIYIEGEYLVREIESMIINK